jgi:hypothetical protein
MSTQQQQRFHTQRQIRPLLKNSVLRLKSAHARPFTDKELGENSRGIRKDKLQSTLAQTPSVYYYLSQKCGIGFKEAEQLVSTQRLYFGSGGDEVVSDVKQLSMQLPFEAVEDLELKIKIQKSSVAADEEILVPVEHRHLHRQYFATYLRAGIRTVNDPALPHSFIYSIPPNLMNRNNNNNGNQNDLNIVKYNFLSGPGWTFRPNVHGFGVVTNDLSMPSYFEKRESGNFGIYRVWFESGVPQEEIDEIARILNDVLVNDTLNFLDDDTKKKVPRFAFSHEGLYFPNRCVMKRTENPFKKKVAKSIWFSTPYLHKSWFRELFLPGTRATSIEHVQLGNALRFLHPETDEYLSASSHQQQKEADPEFEVEKASWKALDQHVSDFHNNNKKNNNSKIPQIVSPGRNSNNWLGHFTPKEEQLREIALTLNEQNKNSKNKNNNLIGGDETLRWNFETWFDPLTPESIQALHQEEKQMKVNLIVKSLRDATA